MDIDIISNIYKDFKKNIKSEEENKSIEVIIFICLIKRILDIQTEYNESDEIKNLLDLIKQNILSYDREIIELNNKYLFFDIDNIEQKNVIFISWLDLIKYEDNPNGEERKIGKNKNYITKSKNFVELMFEIVNCFNRKIIDLFDLSIKQFIDQYISEVNFICKEKFNKYNFNIKNFSFIDFSDIYISFISKFYHKEKSSKNFTPFLLAKNIMYFFDIKNFLNNKDASNILIADIASGSNSFLVYMNNFIMKEFNFGEDKLLFFGQEIDKLIYRFGKINIFLNNLFGKYNKNIVEPNSNVITNYFSGIGKMRGKLDIIISNPPFGKNDEYAENNINYINNNIMEDRWKFGIPKKSDSEFTFLMTVIDLLSKQGKAIVFMPLGTLFRDSSKDIRKNLLREDIIEGLVLLPEKMFLTTSIPVVLWILNKNKKEQDKNKVFMINASKDFKKIDNLNEWQSNRSIDNYLNRTNEINYSGYVDFENIEKNNFNLSVKRYFSEEKEKEEIDIVELLDGIYNLEKNITEKREEIDILFKNIINLE